MPPIELLAAAVALLATVSAGVVVHEFAHALTLRAFSVPYRVDVLPGERDGTLRGSAMGGLASVTPIAVPPDLEPWRLRVAAMAPLALLAPFGLVAAGVVPDPFATGDAVRQAVAVGWLACALPSPSDFALLWHARDALGTTDR